MKRMALATRLTFETLTAHEHAGTQMATVRQTQLDVGKCLTALQVMSVTISCLYNVTMWANLAWQPAAESST